MGTWGGLLVQQFEFYWEAILRPRLDGLTDEEFLWEPVPGCWSVRPGPDGGLVLDEERPAPSPPPVTTIAWRMVHLGAQCLGNRANAFFGDADLPGATMLDPRYLPGDLPGTAADGVAFLERAYRHWHDGVAALDDDALLQPLGPKGDDYADDLMSGLVLHLSRELMHHGGEIGVLRDLYRAGLGGPGERGGPAGGR